jgi:hypothetical protein
MDIPHIRNYGFNAYLDAYAIDRWGAAYFLSLIGPSTAVQSIIASLLSRSGYVEIFHDGFPCEGIALPYKMKFKTIVRRLPSRQQHAILYSEIASSDNSDKLFLVIVKDESLAHEVFFQYLDRRTDIPLHKSWSKWLWDKLFDLEDITQLKTYGIHAYLCDIYEDTLIELITEAVKSGELGAQEK